MLIAGFRHEHRDSRALQAIAEESLRHGENGPQQAYGPKPRGENGFRRGLHDAQQGHVYGSLHFIEYNVHRVGRDEPEIGARPMQPLERLGHFPRRLIPLPVMLPVHKLLKVHAIDQNLRVTVVAKPRRVSPGDVLIVERGGFRAHAAKDAYLLHLFCFLPFDGLGLCARPSGYV